MVRSQPRWFSVVIPSCLPARISTAMSPAVFTLLTDGGGTHVVQGVGSLVDIICYQRINTCRRRKMKTVTVGQRFLNLSLVF